ncbi:phage tail protein [Pseudomonas typographi]|uniref:phage tail protein n=1 Tax=Pseudomonas typographi TaxID=2715964 RepID=UPI003B837B64
MADEFIWCPYIEPTGTGTFRVRSAQFGSGYKQVASDGINNESQSWPLTFRGSEAYVLEILNFLRSKAGYIPFTWTPPLGSQAKFTCTSYGATPLGGGNFTLTATFDQYFGVS